MSLIPLRSAGPEAAGRADPDAVLDALRLAVTAGGPQPDRAHLPERCRRAVDLAERIGAPLLPAVEAAQAAQDDQRRATRAVQVASAQTRVVAGGLLVAPVLLVPGLARLVGADLIGFYTSRTGVIVLVVGSALLLLGAAIVVALVRRVGRSPAGSTRGGPRALIAGVLTFVVVSRLGGPVLALPLTLLAVHVAGRHAGEATVQQDVDEVADLVATALTAGVSGPEALRLVADVLPAHGPRLRRLAFGLELGMGADDLLDGPAHQATIRASRHRGPGRAGTPRRDPLRRLAALLTAAERAGAPVAPNVRHLARQLRADDLARVLAAAERLPAQLTFPTALCLLPATVLLIGAPIVHTGLLAVGA